MITFAKTAQSPQALVAKLIAQNLSIPDPDLASHYITFIGHYRLKGYWFHLIDPTTKQFRQGITFDMIKDRYEFDREIRALILAAVERLEVAIRTVLCNTMSLKYSAHWYLKTELFKPISKFGVGQMLAKIEAEIDRSKGKRFIDAYHKKYDDPYLPPSWAMSECISLGMWSRIFKILRDGNDKKVISAKFGIPQVEVFESWLHTVTVLRNMAAHHDQFLNQKLGVAPTNHIAKKIRFINNNSVYAALTVVHVLLVSIGFNAVFMQRIVELKAKYGMGLMQELGFPNNWPLGASGW